MLDYSRFRDINDLFASGQARKARRLLMEMQSRCIALRDEINMLRLRLQTAEDALCLAQNLYEADRFYWLRSPAGPLGPFCPICFNSDGALIKLDRYKQELVCPYCHETWSQTQPKRDADSSHARILRFIPEF